MSPIFFVSCVCAFASGFALRIIDPLIVPIAQHFALAPAAEIAPSARGSAVALFACGFFVGQGLGPPLFGALVTAFGFTVALLTSVAGLVLIGQVVVRKAIG